MFQILLWSPWKYRCGQRTVRMAVVTCSQNQAVFARRRIKVKAELKLKKERLLRKNFETLEREKRERERTATAGSDVVQSGRPIFDDFFQHLWPYIGNNTANVAFQMIKRLWLIRIDQ
ncbi:hypothetical protein TNCV_4157311 [Trichonephila clavipes]|nr:hypothetical protein TNCV_4157311 [Trichonephila clavipes]